MSALPSYHYPQLRLVVPRQAIGLQGDIAILHPDLKSVHDEPLDLESHREAEHIPVEREPRFGVGNTNGDVVDSRRLHGPAG